MQPATSFCLGTMEPARINGNAILLLGASNLSEHSPRTIIDDNASERGTVMLRAPAEAEVGIEGRPPSALLLRAQFQLYYTGSPVVWQDRPSSARSTPFQRSLTEEFTEGKKATVGFRPLVDITPCRAAKRRWEQCQRGL